LYKVEYRAKVLSLHLGLTYQEMASSLGISKKTFNRWIRDSELTTEEDRIELCKYFKLSNDELYQEIDITISYSYLSGLCNAIATIENDLLNTDPSKALEGISSLKESLKDALIEQQHSLKIK